MNLIDRDALRGLGLRRSAVPADQTISLNDIDAAPTVSCGECQWYDGGKRGVGCRFCYCGDEFERREP